MSHPLKYPRTPHLPWSEGLSPDDILLTDSDMFNGKWVVVTEKLDGENSTLTRDHCHARSLDSKDHPSRHRLKALWATIRQEIPEGIRIIGENLYAKHSIFYDKLPDYFLVFAVFHNDWVLSWEATKEWAYLLNLKCVPVLFEGDWKVFNHQDCYTKISRCGGIQEGYVVRDSKAFPQDKFANNVAKFVRKNHVQTSEHWMTGEMVQNKLAVDLNQQTS